MASIEFDVSLHAEQLQKDIDTINKKIAGIGDEFRKSGGKIDSMFSGIGKSIAGAFAVTAVTAFAKELIDAAGEAYKAEAKVAQAVKQTGMAAGFTADELGKMAKALQGATTFEDDQIMNNVTAQLLTFTNITGENFKKAQVAVMDLATVLDGDLKGAAIQIGKALNDPTTALSALTRSGIQFSAEQKTMIDSLIKQNRLFDAQSVILAEINRQYGGQAEAMAKTPIGRIEQTKNLWSDVKEMMGKVILESESLNVALTKTQKALVIIGSEQLNWGEKIGAFLDPFQVNNAIDKMYDSALIKQKQFEEHQKTVNELAKAGTNEGESSQTTSAPKPPTNLQQIETLRKAIADANKDLNDLRKGDRAANIPAIDAKTEEINNLTKQLESLTGVTQKANDEYKKKQEERLKALKSLLDQEVEMRAQTEASKIALMQDGSDKQIAEAQLAYSSEMENIRKQKEEMLKLLSESGLKVGTPEYDKQKTTIQTTTDAASATAAARLAAERVRIEKEAANQINAIRQQVTDVFLNDQQREIEAINQKYAEIEKTLVSSTKTTGEDWQRMQEAKDSELLANQVNYNLQRISFEEEIAQRTLEIQSDGVRNTLKVEQQKINIYKQKAKERIAELQKLNTVEAGQEIQIITKSIEKWNIDLKNLNEQGILKVVSGFREMADALSDIGGDTGDMIRQMYDFSGIIANVISGNLVGAGAGILQTVIGWYNQTVNSEEDLAAIREESNKLAQELNDLYKERIDLYVQLGLISPTEGAMQNEDLLRQKVIKDQELLENYHHRFLQNINGQNKAFETSFYDMMNSVYGKNWTAANLKEALDDLNTFEGKYAEINKLIIYTNLRLADMPWIPEDDRVKFNEDVNAIIADWAELNKALNENPEVSLGIDSENIAESIIDGFREGYASAEDFASNFEDLMKNAVVNALKNQILAGTGPGSLNEWYKQFFDFNKDGMTPEEIDALKASWGEMVKVQKSLYDNANSIIGLGNSASSITGASGMSGNAVRALTEETGSLFVGQFTAMREYQEKSFKTGLQQMESINTSVVYLAEIAANTRYNINLVTIRELINETNGILKSKL